MENNRKENWALPVVIIGLVLLILLCINPFFTMIGVWFAMIAFSYYK